jgi:mTERF domain-containing protein
VYVFAHVMFSMLEEFLILSMQILSLSVDKSLRPKCDYLTKELKCSLQILTSFPAYLSLSLEKRIRPRHKFLEARNRLPAGPFPMHLLAITDEEFCERWAKSTVEEYHVFRQSLLLTTFAKQFEKRHRWNYNQ